MRNNKSSLPDLVRTSPNVIIRSLYCRCCLPLASGVLCQWVSGSHANTTCAHFTTMSWLHNGNNLPCQSASQVSAVSVEEVPCTILSMEFFDRLQTAGEPSAWVLVSFQDLLLAASICFQISCKLLVSFQDLLLAAGLIPRPPAGFWSRSQTPSCCTHYKWQKAGNGLVFCSLHDIQEIFS